MAIDPRDDALAHEREARIFAEELVALLCLEVARLTRAGVVPVADRDRVEDLLAEAWRRLGGLDRL